MRHFNLRPLLYIIISLLFFLSCSDNKPKVVGKQALLKEKIIIGDSLFNAGNYRTASEYYKKALIIQPNNQYVTKKLKEINVKTGITTPVEKDTPKTKIASTTKSVEKTKPAIKKKTTTKVAKAKPVVTKKKTTRVAYKNSNTKINFLKNPYHIIIGSFKIRNNAIKLANKFNNKGYNTVQISRFNGEYTAVSIISLNNIHTAYNNMLKIRRKFSIDDAWVLYQKTNSVTSNTTPNSNNNTYAENPYNIVIGSFKVKRNADLLLKKYKEKGYKAIKISRFNGEFTAVAIAFSENYKSARKNLYNVKNNLGIDAWILQQ